MTKPGEAEFNRAIMDRSKMHDQLKELILGQAARIQELETELAATQYNSRSKIARLREKSKLSRETVQSELARYDSRYENQDQ
jgi:DNA-binding transcriptional regulator YiaG